MNRISCKFRSNSGYRKLCNEVFEMFIWNENLRQNDLKGKRWTKPKKKGGD